MPNRRGVVQREVVQPLPSLPVRKRRSGGTAGRSLSLGATDDTFLQWSIEQEVLPIEGSFWRTGCLEDKALCANISTIFDLQFVVAAEEDPVLFVSRAFSCDSHPGPWLFFRDSRAVTFAIHIVREISLTVFLVS